MDSRPLSLSTRLSIVALLLVAVARPAAGQAEFRTGMCPAPNSVATPDLSAVVDGPAEPPRLLVDPPRYPDEVRRDGYRGQVVLALVVDTLGVPMPGTAAVMSSTDPVLSRWACATARVLRFAPARHQGRPVAAQAVQPFAYSARVTRRPDR
jgi:TonB family protein